MKNTVCILTIFIFTFGSANAQLIPKDTLYLSHNNAYECGYVNQKGDVIIPYGRYSMCFTDTLVHFSVVLIRNKDTLGFYAINQQEVRLFKVVTTSQGPTFLVNGFIQVTDSSGLIGFANERGKVVIVPQFQCATDFYGGKALVTYKCTLRTSQNEVPSGPPTSDNWFYIDKTGKRVD